MCVVLSSTGSKFRSVGPETEKLRGPMRTVRVRGTARFRCAADRRRWEHVSSLDWFVVGLMFHFDLIVVTVASPEGESQESNRLPEGRWLCLRDVGPCVDGRGVGRPSKVPVGRG